MPLYFFALTYFLYIYVLGVHDLLSFWLFQKQIQAGVHRSAILCHLFMCVQFLLLCCERRVYMQQMDSVANILTLDPEVVPSQPFSNVKRLTSHHSNGGPVPFCVHKSFPWCDPLLMHNFWPVLKEHRVVHHPINLPLPLYLCFCCLACNYGNPKNEIFSSPLSFPDSNGRILLIKVKDAALTPLPQSLQHPPNNFIHRV